MDQTKRASGLLSRTRRALRAFRESSDPGWRLGRSLGSSVSRYDADGDYLDNAYSDIVKAANGFAKIEPYFADAKKRPIKSPLLDALYRPNTGMSASQFRKNMAINLLVHDKFYILVHDKQDDFSIPVRSVANVTGYDILAPRQVSLDSDGNVTAATLNNHQVQVNPTRVLEMSDVLDPRDLSKGYAAYRAMIPWARLDDLNRRAQTLYFKRGGTPNGIAEIAGTADQYQAVKRSIIDSMADGGGNSEPIFSHTPVVNGKAAPSMITWHQIQSNARDMTSSQLLSFVEKKLSNPIGVPNEVKGQLQNSNYASVIMAEWIFNDSVVEPIATAIYDKLTAELSNIFGDIKGQFTYESIKPAFADEELKKSQTDTVNLANIDTLTSKGYTIEGAVEILGLPPRFLAMANDKYKLDNSNVQNGNDTPDSATACIHHDHSKAADKSDYYIPKRVDLSRYTNKLQRTAQLHKNALVNNYISGLTVKSAADDAGAETEREQSDDELAMMVAVWVTMAIIYAGNQRVNSATSYLRRHGIALPDIEQYTAGDTRLTRSVSAYDRNPTSDNLAKMINSIQMTSAPLIVGLKQHLQTVAKNYSQNIRNEIASVVDGGVKNGATPSQIVSELRTMMKNNDAERLAQSEMHRADGLQQIDQVKYLSGLTGIDVYKGTKTGSHPCEFCQSMVGQWFKVNDAMVAVGQTMEGVDGGTRKNNYEDITCAHYHPYCQCQNAFLYVFNDHLEMKP